jgi:hypothetical protein
MKSPSSVPLGAQEPQTLRAPDADTTAGPEAVALAAACGLTCDEWQAQVLHRALGEHRLSNGEFVWAARTVLVVVSRQNGKGSLLEALALSAALMEQGRTIAWTAHEHKTAQEAYRRLQFLISSSEELARQVRRSVKGNNETSIEFLNGSRIVFTTRTSGALRGFTISLLIMDEAYALTDDQMSAILPTLSAAKNPQVWLTSSPPLSSDTGEVMFQLREAALAGAEGIAYFDWGVPGVDLSDLVEVALDDVQLWAATNPAYGVRINHQAVLAERASMTKEAFARERLGIWPRRMTKGSGVVDAELWAELADTTAPRPADVVFAIDINPGRTYTAIVACGLRSDGAMQTLVIDYRPGTAWVVDRLADLRDRWSPLAIALDVKGPAASLLLDLDRLGIKSPEDLERPRRGDLAVPNAQQVAQAYGLWIDAVREKRLRHLDEGPLNLALTGAKTRSLAGGTAWDRKGDTDICPLVASTLAHWAYVTRAHLARQAEYDLLASVY